MSLLRKYILYKQLKSGCKSHQHFSTRVIIEDNGLKVSQCEICGQGAYSIAYDPTTRRIHQLPPYWNFRNIEVKCGIQTE